MGGFLGPNYAKATRGSAGGRTSTALLSASAPGALEMGVHTWLPLVPSLSAWLGHHMCVAIFRISVRMISQFKVHYLWARIQHTTIGWAKAEAGLGQDACSVSNSGSPSSQNGWAFLWGHFHGVVFLIEALGAAALGAAHGAPGL